VSAALASVGPVLAAKPLARPCASREASVCDVGAPSYTPPAHDDPPVDELSAYLERSFRHPAPTRERGVVLYVGRLAAVPAPRAGVAGDLAAALAEIPNRRSKLLNSK
jgi:hypothetical protein